MSRTGCAGVAMTEFRDSLGELVRALRHEEGLTQEELAARSHLSRKYIGEIERGEANVTVRTLEQIAEGLEREARHIFNVRPASSLSADGTSMRDLTSGKGVNG